MSAVQLSFSLRVSGVKTVHLVGSWDGYDGQLPLSKDKSSSSSSSRSGSWKGTFRFHNDTLEPGQRYWYYYVVDGYHATHDPAVSSVTEPCTGREMNILDVPSARHHSSSSSSSSSSSRKSSSSSSSKSSSSSSRSSYSSSKSSSSHKSSSKSSSSRHHSSRDDHRSSRSRGSLSVDIPKGRPLSVSQIQAPRPMAPHATKHILEADYYDSEALEELTSRFGVAGLDDDADVVTNFASSPVSSTGSSFSYRSDSSSPNSSRSGYSTPGSDCSACTCERYGITRKGERVKLDCGGSRCGYDDDSSLCGSDSEEEYEYEPVDATSRRHGMVVGQ